MTSTKDTPQIAQQQLEAVEKMRQDFVANVSHELRTPLTVIKGYLEMLVEQPTTLDFEQWQPKFQQMFAQSLRMEQLIADLLLLSKLETDFSALEEQAQCNMSSMLQTICDEARTISHDRMHVISLECDKSLNLICNADEIRSAISNLVFNAVKYTPNAGSIKVIWRQREDGGAECVVKDTGIGIKEKHIPRLTERFYRVDKARSRENGGTGLGLAIAKHVLLRHDAELTIDSVFGEGSEFRCVFKAESVCF